MGPMMLMGNRPLPCTAMSTQLGSEHLPGRRRPMDPVQHQCTSKHDVGWFLQHKSPVNVSMQSNGSCWHSALFRVCKARKMFAPTSMQTGYGMVGIVSPAKLWELSCDPGPCSQHPASKLHWSSSGCCWHTWNASSTQKQIYTTGRAKSKKSGISEQPDNQPRNFRILLSTRSTTHNDILSMAMDRALHNLQERLALGLLFLLWPGAEVL